MREESWKKPRTRDWFSNLLPKIQSGEIVVRCGCGRGLGRQALPRICVRRSDAELNWFRRRIAEHDETYCPLDILRRARQRPSEFSAKIFGAFVPPSKINPKRSEAQTGAGKRNASWDFDSAMTYLGAEANLRAFNRFNPSFGILSQPSVWDWLHAWDEVAGEEQISGGRSPRAGASDQECALTVGLIIPDRGHIRPDIECLVVDWFRAGRFERWAHFCPRMVAEKALKALVHDKKSIISPPYLAVGLVEKDGEVRRLWLRPIWLSCKGIALVDSNIERRAWDLEDFDRQVVFRPILEADLRRLDLLRSVRDFETIDRIWDGVRFERDHCRSSMIGLIENFGYKPGSNAEYDLRRERTTRRMALLNHPFVGVGIEGWNLKSGPRPAWNQLGLDFRATHYTPSITRFLASRFGGVSALQ